MTDGKAGLYLHLPFCRSKCHYCGFYSLTTLEQVPAFLASLCREMEMYRQNFSTFDSLYIGGGTPSLLSVTDIAMLLEAATTKFTLASDAEVTLEANPADLTSSYLRSLRKLGINRLNIGVQSFDDTLLRVLGRRHDCHQAFASITAACEAGFENVGLDLMYGIPGQSLASWADTLGQMLMFRPSHLSCYQLSLESGTVLYEQVHKGRTSMPDENRRADFFFQTAVFLEEAGYLQYEVSNFSRDAGSRSRHNQKYWHHEPYLGLGPSAHSFLGNKRWWNYGNLETYLARLSDNLPPCEGEETLSTEDMRLEALFLGLRTADGISISDFRRRFQYDLLVEKEKELALLFEDGKLELTNGFLRPTRNGMAVADSLALI